MKEIAESEEAMREFETDALIFIEPDEHKRAVLDRHVPTRLYKIEQWLRKGGFELEPSIIRGHAVGTLDGGDLLALCIAAIDSTPAPTSASGGGPSGASIAPSKMRVSVRTETPGETVSEQERRDRSMLAADMATVETDGKVHAELLKMAALAGSGEAADKETLKVLVQTSAGGALRRVLYTPIEVNSLTVDAEPATVERVNLVRHELDRAL